jgi:hypothetical protein
MRKKSLREKLLKGEDSVKKKHGIKRVCIEYNQTDRRRSAGSQYIHQGKRW